MCSYKFELVIIWQLVHSFCCRAPSGIPVLEYWIRTTLSPDVPSWRLSYKHWDQSPRARQYAATGISSVELLQTNLKPLGRSWRSAAWGSWSPFPVERGVGWSLLNCHQNKSNNHLLPILIFVLLIFTLQDFIDQLQRNLTWGHEHSLQPQGLCQRNNLCEKVTIITFIRLFNIHLLG